MSEYLTFTSESVSEGHPDKMADQISDAILDAVLKQDKHARVAIETLVKTGAVILAGELKPPRTSTLSGSCATRFARSATTQARSVLTGKPAR